jgi:hypothetical protein
MNIALIDLIYLISGLFQILSFCVLVYVIQTKLEIMENHLKQNNISTETKSNWEAAGFIGKIPRISMIFVSLVLASYWSKRGFLNLDEAQRFPLRLRLWIYIPIITGFSCSAILIFPLELWA